MYVASIIGKMKKWVVSQACLAWVIGERGVVGGPYMPYLLSGIHNGGANQSLVWLRNVARHHCLVTKLFFIQTWLLGLRNQLPLSGEPLRYVYICTRIGSSRSDVNSHKILCKSSASVA